MFTGVLEQVRNEVPHVGLQVAATALDPLLLQAGQQVSQQFKFGHPSPLCRTTLALSALSIAWALQPRSRQCDKLSTEEWSHCRREDALSLGNHWSLSPDSGLPFLSRTPPPPEPLKRHGRVRLVACIFPFTRILEIAA